MAYLRRGLVTNRGAIPSVHTKQSNAPSHYQTHDDPHQGHHDAQPVLVLRKVKRVIKMGQGDEFHIVELECGHTTRSRGTFQTVCKQCGNKHE